MRRIYALLLVAALIAPLAPAEAGLVGWCLDALSGDAVLIESAPNSTLGSNRNLAYPAPPHRVDARMTLAAYGHELRLATLPYLTRPSATETRLKVWTSSAAAGSGFRRP